MGFIATIRESFRSLVSPTGIMEGEYGLDPLATPALAPSAPVPEAQVPGAGGQVSGPDTRRPKPDTSLVGASGTPIFYGFVRDLGEYNPRLEGREGFRIYEQMRRSDADVAAALAACKLPIRAADWQVVPAEESVRQPTDRSQESEGSKTSSTGAGRVTQDRKSVG